MRTDSSGTLPDGTNFDGPAAMRQTLAGKVPQLAQCLVQKMLIFALGRGVDVNDRRNIADIMRAWEGKEYRLQSLVFEVTHSLPFQSRRGEAAREAASQ